MQTLSPCQACGTVHSYPFCPECGQERLERFTFRRLIYPVIELFEVDHGMAHTFWTYLKHPRQVTLAYVGGNTKTYTNPLKLLVIAMTISFFFSIYLINHMVEQMAVADGAATKTSAEIIKQMNEHGDYVKYLNILMLPVYGWFLKLLFKAKGYNLAEHILIFAYAWAVSTILLLPFEASLYLLLKAGYNINYQLQSMSGLVALLIQLWFLAKVYASEGRFMSTLGRLILAILGVSSVSGIIGFVVGFFMKPELFN